MNGFLKKAAAGLMVIAAAASCRETINEMSLDTEELISFTAAGGPGILRFTPYSNWSIISSEKWISLTTGAGLGNGNSISVTYSVAENSSPDPRTAVITVSSGGTSKSVTVTQDQKNVISTDLSDIVLDELAQDFTVRLKANVDCLVSVDADWIHRKDTKGLSESALTFAAEANPGTAERSGTISIREKDSGAGKSISVRQKASPAMLGENVCGIYGENGPLLSFSGNGSQTGLVKGPKGSEVHLVNSATRQFCLLKDMPADLADKGAGDSFSICVEHNTDEFSETSFTMEITVRKKEDGLLWCWDRTLKTGAIIRVE